MLTLRLLIIIIIVSVTIIPSTYSSEMDSVGPPPSGLTMLQMDKVDLPGFIKVIGKLLNKNIILDKQVSGEVTIQSTKGFTLSQVQLLYESVLEMNRLTEIQGDGFVKVVPRAVSISRSLAINSVDKGSNMTTAILWLKNVSAAKASLVVRPFMSQDGVLSVLPTLGMIILTDSGATVAKISHILKAVDRNPSSDVRVVRLYNSNAAASALSLMSMFPTTGLAATAYPDGITVLLTGSPSAIGKASAVLSTLDEKSDITISHVEVIQLQESETTIILNILKSTPKLTQGLEVSGDKTRNTIILAGSANDRARVIKAILKLDTPRPQIRIEVIVAEVSGDEGLDFGIDWKTSNSKAFAGGVGAGNVSVNGAMADTGKQLVLGLFTGTPLSFGVLLKALQTSTSTNILSIPVVTVMDNDKASLVVGQNVPFVTGSAGANGGANPFQTIERKDIGLKLEITPTVLSSGRVQMVITQEVSSLSSSTAASDIITNKRAISTVATTASGSILVIGGLIQDDTQSAKSGLPFFSQLPYIGAAFGSTSKTRKRTNLMVFIHPVILKDPDAYTTRKWDETKRLFPTSKGLLYLPED